MFIFMGYIMMEMLTTMIMMKMVYIKEGNLTNTWRRRLKRAIRACERLENATIHRMTQPAGSAKTTDQVRRGMFKHWELRWSRFSSRTHACPPCRHLQASSLWSLGPPLPPCAHHLSSVIRKIYDSHVFPVLLPKATHHSTLHQFSSSLLDYCSS